MNRYQINPTAQPTAEGRPDMTVLEAAQEMERAHRHQLLVRHENRLIGLLTEADIVRKVLAAGRRPDAVTIGDIMHAGRIQADGSLLLEDDPSPGEWNETGVEIGQGKCEECGVYNNDLGDSDGLLLCPDCRETHEMLYV